MKGVLKPDEIVLTGKIANTVHHTFFKENAANNLNQHSEVRITDCSNFTLSQSVFKHPVLTSVVFKDTYFSRLCEIHPFVQSATVFIYPNKKRYVLHVKTIREEATVSNRKVTIDLSMYKVPTVESADPQWWNLTRSYTSNDTMCSLCVCISVHLFMLARPLLALSSDGPGKNAIAKAPKIRISKDEEFRLLRCTLFVSTTQGNAYKINQELYEMLHNISKLHIVQVDVVVEAQLKQHRIVIKVKVCCIPTAAPVDWSPEYVAPSSRHNTHVVHKRARTQPSFDAGSEYSKKVRYQM